jgi:hypothetical protein
MAFFVVVWKLQPRVNDFDPSWHTIIAAQSYHCHKSISNNKESPKEHLQENSFNLQMTVFTGVIKFYTATSGDVTRNEHSCAEYFRLR